jgi:hypothetical protein
MGDRDVAARRQLRDSPELRQQADQGAGSGCRPFCRGAAKRRDDLRRLGDFDGALRSLR